MIQHILFQECTYGSSQPQTRATVALTSDFYITGSNDNLGAIYEDKLTLKSFYIAFVGVGDNILPGISNDLMFSLSFKN